MHCNTVLGIREIDKWGMILPHEHVCCYLEALYSMAGNAYMDKEQVTQSAIAHLRALKETYGLSALVDCTPINLGRDLQMLRAVSSASGVEIIASTGFYYTEEPLVGSCEEDFLAELLLRDVENAKTGLLKFAVAQARMSPTLEKTFAALCQVQRRTGLPLCIHTNACIPNGEPVLDFAMAQGVAPNAMTIAHCSDSQDMDYVTRLLERGCYVGFDRIYDRDADYADQKAKDIRVLIDRGFLKRILLSHDGLEFSGFHPEIRNKARSPYAFIMRTLLPQMRAAGYTEQEIRQMTVHNPQHMLCGSCT